MRIAREIRYDNAGTIEFLYDLDRHEWFFIEMNPRIQVEHTVTEEITDVDLVQSQMRIASGETIATLAFSLIIQEVFTRWDAVTHGLKGRPVDKPVIFGVSFSPSYQNSLRAGMLRVANTVRGSSV